MKIFRYVNDYLVGLKRGNFTHHITDIVKWLKEVDKACEGFVEKNYSVSEFVSDI